MMKPTKVDTISPAVSNALEILWFTERVRQARQLANLPPAAPRALLRGLSWSRGEQMRYLNSGIALRTYQTIKREVLP